MKFDDFTGEGASPQDFAHDKRSLESLISPQIKFLNLISKLDFWG
jgi:hypothetical protein